MHTSGPPAFGSTPGPWTAERMRLPDNAKDRRCGFVINGPDEEPLPKRICDLRVPAGMEGFQEGQSNANLIAAAPELLEALIRVRQAFYVDGTSKALRKAFEGTKELVAKAKGESA